MLAHRVSTRPRRRFCLPAFLLLPPLLAPSFPHRLPRNYARSKAAAPYYILNNVIHIQSRQEHVRLQYKYKDCFDAISGYSVCIAVSIIVTHYG